MRQCLFHQQIIFSENVEENRQLMTTELLLIYKQTRLRREQCFDRLIKALLEESE